MKKRKTFLSVALLASVVTVGCAIPAWVNTVESDAEVAAPIVASLVGVIVPSAAPIDAIVVAGFNALTKTFDTFKASPTASNLQAVQSAVAAVNANVQQLESAAQIKNGGTDAKVAAIVALINELMAEIVSAVPAPTSGASILNVHIPGTAPGLHGGRYFKNQYNALIKGDSRFHALK